MKYAKEQTYDLSQASDFMTSLTHPDRQEKDKAKPLSLRQVNGRPKLSRQDTLSRFSEPPAPPPKQPLPEKPDAPRMGNSDSAITSNLKRSDTEKPKLPGSSPGSRESSQILSLVEALAFAKKELDAQSVRVKELENLLTQERVSRESAEERARSLESSSTAQNGVSEVETLFERPSKTVTDASENVTVIEPTEEQAPRSADDSSSVDTSLQQRLDAVMAEMGAMRKEVETYKESAEQAQNDAAESRKTLAEMVESIRRDRANSEIERKAVRDASRPEDAEILHKKTTEASVLNCIPLPVRGSDLAHIKQVENTVAPLTKQRYRNHLAQQSAPYASMLGVVLLGVGIMAYLNGWQKVDK